MNSYALPTMAAEIRESFPEITDTDDYRCFRDFCEKIIAPNCKSDGLEYISELDGEKTTTVRSFVQRASEKRQTTLRRSEKEANELYARFKAQLADLIKTDEAIAECAEMASAEATFGFDIASNISMIKTGVTTYYMKHQVAVTIPTLQQTYKCMVDCFKCLLLGINPCPQKAVSAVDAMSVKPEEVKTVDEVGASVRPVFTETTEFLREPIMKLFTIFQRVNPGVRQQLIGDFKELLRRIVTCFVLYRFPVKIPGSTAPVFFGKFIPEIKLKDIMEPLGMTLSELTIYP